MCAKATSAKSGEDMDTREQLLKAAGDLMVERNSVNVSFSDIAQKSGVNAALIKYYFGNKSGMLLALVRKVVLTSVMQMDDLLKMHLSPEEKLRIHIHGIVNTYYRYPYINRLLHYILSLDEDDYGVVVADEVMKPLAKAQRAILEEGIAAGVFRPVDPMLFYFHLIGACDHLFYARKALKFAFGVTEVTDDLKSRYAKHLYDLMINGLLTTPGRAG